MATTTFRLISRSTTTRWFDWEHGDLWLSANALLRHRRGWIRTFSSVGLAQDLRASESDPLIEHQFGDAVVGRILEEGGRFIRSETITSAHLRAGIITGRVRLQLDDGQAVKFLWAKSNLTYGALHGALARWLGDRLVLE